MRPKSHGLNSVEALEEAVAQLGAAQTSPAASPSSPLLPCLGASALFGASDSATSLSSSKVMGAALWALAELFEGPPGAMPPHFEPNEWEDLWLHTVEADHRVRQTFLSLEEAGRLRGDLGRLCIRSQGTSR